LTAFANAEGGTLVLGLHETTDDPRRAERLDPLPNCEGLARRILDASEDIVEPRLRSIEARALPADKAGNGYDVVLRVGKSAAGPHRLRSTKEFYIRRGERAAKMDVREIKDLTLDLARTGDRIVGFIVTNLSRPADRVVAFYNNRGTCEQWIKEGKGRSSGHGCRAERSRPTPCGSASCAPYNLGNFLRTLATPEPIKDWSLTSLKEKLIKVGAKVVSHGRYVVFQMAEVAIPRQMFQEILRLIAELRPQPPPAPA
jgi:hypothetical protein